MNTSPIDHPPSLWRAGDDAGLVDPAESPEAVHIRDHITDGGVVPAMGAVDLQDGVVILRWL
jgi:hypothetical protein